MTVKHTPRWHFPSRLFRGLVLGIIVLYGATLRFRHLDWAQGYYFQPDENAYTTEYVLKLPPSLNPYEVGPYTYGGLPLYLYFFSARVLVGLTGDAVWADKWHITLIARTCAAVTSTATIPLVYAIWRRLGDVRAGWISALALAVSPLSIQYAHYGVVDTLLSFWVVLISCLSTWAWRSERLIYWGIVGLAVGLAIATKTSGLVWGLTLVVAAWGYWVRVRTLRASLYVLSVGMSGVLVGMFLGSPYYLLDWPSFWRVMSMQGALTVTGQRLATWNWQFLAVMPFVFELRQLAMWAIGLPLCVLGLLGAMSLWKRAVWPQVRVEWLILLLSPTVYFLNLGLWHSKFIRYLLPFVPYVALSVAQPLRLVLESRFRLARWGISTVMLAALLYSSLLGSALSNVYAAPDPRVQASEWMLDHLPAGTTILHDPEPLITLPLDHEQQFNIRVLDLYGNRLRNLNHLNFYVQALRDQQFVVVVSRRNYGTLSRLSALFPQAACYYRTLFNGNLGYELKTEFYNYPHLGPFVWNTDQAEETFQVFDHPHVYIFERTQEKSPEEIRAVLDGCT